MNACVRCFCKKRIYKESLLEELETVSKIFVEQYEVFHRQEAQQSMIPKNFGASLKPYISFGSSYTDGGDAARQASQAAGSVLQSASNLSGTVTNGEVFLSTGGNDPTIKQVETRAAIRCTCAVMLQDGSIIAMDEESKNEFKRISSKVLLLRRAASRVALEFALDSDSVLHVRGSGTIISTYEIGENFLVVHTEVIDAQESYIDRMLAKIDYDLGVRQQDLFSVDNKHENNILDDIKSLVDKMTSTSSYWGLSFPS